MASPEKKLQLSGWSKRPYRDIRSKVNKLAEEYEPRHRRLSLKKPTTCRGGVAHSWSVIKERLSFFKTENIKELLCNKCGKKKYHYDKIKDTDGGFEPGDTKA